MRKLKVISIIGPGRVGTAVGFALFDKGVRVDGVYKRSARSKRQLLHEIADSLTVLSTRSFPFKGIILVAVPDSSIKDVVSLLASTRCDFSEAIFLHFSGLECSAIFDPLRCSGAKAGALHPMVSMTPGSTSDGIFKGVFWTFEGDPKAQTCARDIVALLEGNFVKIRPEMKPLYHASAVMASNYMIPVLESSFRLLKASGFDRNLAKTAMLPLVNSAVRNFMSNSSEFALTGPIARGDFSTVREHLGAITRNCPDMLANYVTLGLVTCTLAEDATSNASGLKKIRSALLKELNSLYGRRK